MRITVLKFRPCTSQAPRIVLLTLYLASSLTGFITSYHRQTNILHPPSHQLETLQVKAKQYFTHGLADSTQRTYSAPQRQYLAFSSRLDLSPFPASEQTLMLFVTELASRIHPQSIPVNLSAIHALHIAHGYPIPLDDTLQLRQTFRGISRLHGITAKQKLAVTYRTARRHEAIHFPQLS